MYYNVDIYYRGINHLSDGRFAAGIWAKWAGFCFDSSSDRYVTPTDAAEIIQWMQGPELVAEFGTDADLEIIKDVTSTLGIKSISIPNEIYSSEMDDLFDSVIFLDSLPSNSISNKHLLLEKEPGDNGIWQIPDFSEKTVESIKAGTVNSICLTGSNEDKPGTADYESISVFMEQLED
jgi:hypothetical protein